MQNTNNTTTTIIVTAREFIEGYGWLLVDNYEVTNWREAWKMRHRYARMGYLVEWEEVEETQGHHLAENWYEDPCYYRDGACSA